MKNILIVVTHTILPPTKAWSKLIYEFGKHLSASSNVHIIQPECKIHDEWSNIHFSNILPRWNSRFMSLVAIFDVVKYIRNHSIDLVIFEYPWLVLYMMIIKLLTWVKLVIHEHNIEYERFRSIWKRRWRLLYPYEALAYYIVDDVLYITTDDQKKWNKVFLTKSTWQYCPYWVNPTEFNDYWLLEARNNLLWLHSLSPDTLLILFFWSHTYFPNREAVDIIENELLHRLNKSWRKYTIFVCWWWLPSSYVSHDGIVYTWFVDDIVAYIKWCDIMINPIMSWWGLKTKVIETLACWKKIISTSSWAKWVSISLPKQFVIADDWDEFVEEMLADNDFIFQKEMFLDHYDRDNIVSSITL